MTRPPPPGPGTVGPRAEYLEALTLRAGPSVAMSEAYAALPPAQRARLLDQVRGLVVAQLPPGVVTQAALATLPAAARSEVETLLALARAATPAELEAFFAGRDLDLLAPLPPRLFRYYHEKVMREPGPDGRTPRARLVAADRADLGGWAARVAVTPGYLGDDPRPGRLELLGEGDAVPDAEVPRDQRDPAPGGLGVRASFVLDLPEWVLVNSVRLARVLNHLSDPGGAPVRVEGRGVRAAVASGPELVDALGAAGFELAVFDARMCADLVNLWVERDGGLLPVRIPTWISTDLCPASPEAAPAAPGAERVVVPGNHAEHLLGVYRPGEVCPEALVRWFMAIPSADDPAQGTSFKPAIWRRTSWCGYRVARAYGEASAARYLVDAGGRLMRLFNAMQLRYAFPHHGYGVMAVCNDTSALMEVGLLGGPEHATVWPSFRDPALDELYSHSLEGPGLALGPGGLGEPVLGVPSDARPDHFPGIDDRRVVLARVGATITARDPTALQFPALRGWVEGLAARSEVFARALGARTLHGEAGIPRV